MLLVTLLRVSPAVLLALLNAACITPLTTPRDVNNAFEEIIAQRHNAYQFKAGDTLDINLYNREGDINQDGLVVLPDGRSDIYFLDNVRLEGMTVRQLEDAFRASVVDSQVRDTEISVQVLPYAEEVHLVGEFVSPGTIPLKTKMTLHEAIAAAGGLRVTGDTNWALLRRPFRNPRHPDLFRIDLNDESEEIFLLPGDQIVLGRTVISGFVNYFREYFWGLFPFGALWAAFL